MSKFPLRDKCEEKAARLSMPHFTLLACDNIAITAVEHWLEMADELGISDAKYKEARALITAMHDWRTLNPDLCKNPD